MSDFLTVVTVNELPPISSLGGKQGLFILPDGREFINRKNNTWYEKPNPKSGITGRATESNAPYNLENFEIYKVVEPITTASAWGFAVTQAELDENFVFFNVVDGVVSLEMKPVEAGKSAYQSYLATTTDSPPMTEAEWSVSFGFNISQSELIYDTAIEQKLGVTEDVLYQGAITSNVVSNSAAIRINNKPILKNGIIYEISFKAGSPTQTYYHIEKQADSSYKVKEKAVFIGLTVGNDYVKTINWDAKIDDLVGVYIDATQPVQFNTAFENHFIIPQTYQYGNSNFGLPPATVGSSVYSFKVHIEGMTGDETTAILKDIKDAGGFKNSVESYDSAILEKAGVSGLVNYTNNVIGTGISTTKALRVNKLPFLNDGFLTELTFRAGAASQLFVVIEKNNTGSWTVVNAIRYDYEFTVGETYIKTLDIAVKKGQMLGIWIEGDFGGYYEDRDTNLYATSNMYTIGSESTLLEGAGSFAYSFKINSIGLTGDETINILKDLKINGSNTNIEGIIYASQRGVSVLNTAAQNTTILNALIVEAFNKKSKLILPTGVIKHTGLTYKEGVNIEGQGMTSTTLQNVGGTFCIRDLDTGDMNTLNVYGKISDLTIRGDAATTDYNLDLRSYFFMRVERVVFKVAKVANVRYEGMLTHQFESTKFQESTNGIIVKNAIGTMYGPMHSNLLQYNNCYFVLITGWCVQLLGSANVAFNSCNFEQCGTAGVADSGGVKAIGLSPDGIGIGFALNSCWSEVMRGTWVSIAGGSCTSIIRDSFCWAATGVTVQGIQNSGGQLLITGGFNFTGVSNQVNTINGGVTKNNSFNTDITHTEASGGQFKSVTYS